MPSNLSGCERLITLNASTSKIIIFCKKNKGKGSAIKAGLNACKSPLVLIQDADQEYNPSDIKDLYQPFINSNVDTTCILGIN